MYCDKLPLSFYSFDAFQLKLNTLCCFYDSDAKIPSDRFKFNNFRPKIMDVLLTNI